MVDRLHRVKFGPLHLGGLGTACARNLTPEEIERCYNQTYDAKRSGSSVEMEAIPQVLRVSFVENCISESSDGNGVSCTGRKGRRVVDNIRPVSQEHNSMDHNR